MPRTADVEDEPEVGEQARGVDVCAGYDEGSLHGGARPSRNPIGKTVAFSARRPRWPAGASWPP